MRFKFQTEIEIPVRVVGELARLSLPPGEDGAGAGAEPKRIRVMIGNKNIVEDLPDDLVDELIDEAEDRVKGSTGWKDGAP